MPSVRGNEARLDQMQKLALKHVLMKQSIVATKGNQSLQVHLGFAKLRENVQAFKVNNAASMIQKMSNLSRGFIVANSLCKIIAKNQ